MFIGNINGELLFVYGLILLVIVLIIFIIVTDKKDKKKKPQNLFDTLNMKIIEDSSTKDSFQEEIEVIEVLQNEERDNFSDLKPISEREMVISNTVRDTIEELENSYVETDLEKTQAQIRVEEITKALKEAEIEEKIEEDKYKQFEEEQEQNAIISFNELMASYDKLYSENEKIQYLEDDKIPINIEELYHLSNTEESKKTVVLEDLADLTKSRKIEKTTVEAATSTFKSSPLLSPVYGIQKPPIDIHNNSDKELQDANQFLQSLKELRNSLDLKN